MIEGMGESSKEAASQSTNTETLKSEIKSVPCSYDTVLILLTHRATTRTR